MKKIILIIFGFIFLNAQTLNFVLPDENNAETNRPQQTTTTQNGVTTTVEDVEEFDDTYVTISTKIDLAVVIDKRRFYRFIPSIMNSFIAYFTQKGIDYHIALYNSDVNFSKIPQKDIIFYATDPKELAGLKDYNKTFYIPLINKADANTSDLNVTGENIYFGCVDLKAQTKKLAQLIDSKTYVVTDNTLLAKRLMNYEQNISYIRDVFIFPEIKYWKLKNSFIIFNTSTNKTAQVLSKITQKDIDTKLALTSQIGYDPFMIMLTQPADVEKLIIANSIIHPPLLINEYANLLNTNIRYNWINYAGCILANKAYNAQNGEDQYYMSDFNIYIFNNQINYKTKLYRIIYGAFKEVE